MGSSSTIALTNANVTLTVAQAAFFLFILTGTLSGNVQLIFPAVIGGGRHIFNQATGAFTVTALNGPSDPGGGVVIPQGYPMPVILTAGQAYYDNYSAIAPGVVQPFGGAAIPPGFLLCYGQTLSQTNYPLLYAALGTTWGPAAGGNFTNADYRGIVLAGADNMGGSAANRLTGYSLGVTGGAQNITLAASQLPVSAYHDSGHVHGIVDPGHTHNVLGTTSNLSGGPSAVVDLSGSSPVSTTTSSTTNITISSGVANITNAGGGGATPLIQPTAAVNMMIRY
jgi:microcystin-dependent protein